MAASRSAYTDFIYAETSVAILSHFAASTSAAEFSTSTIAFSLPTTSA